MLMTVLSVLLLVTCVVMVFLVLSQDVKGGGLAGALGGGAVQTAFGGRSAESITKLTAWIALFFFLLILGMNLLHAPSTVGLTDTGESDKGASGSTNK